ncbi:MAG: cation transporter [Candidatus Aminicenantes bacterium]|nr:cation transporter [Candidatus Aminicenantes bacterium]
MKHHHNHHRNNSHTAIKNIKVALALNLGFTVLEVAGGIFTNSVAIISNALHDLGDSLSLGLAWYFQKISNKKGDESYSFGYKRFSLLGAVINSLVLVIGSVFVLNETIPRLFKPETANVKGMFFLAIFGVMVNGAAVFRLKKGNSINEKIVSLHLLEDVFGWGAILIGSVVMIFVNLPILDPVLSVLITLYVLFNVFKNLKISIRIFLQAVPGNTNIELIKKKILNLPGITDVHDIHIWTLDGEYNILSIHLVIKEAVNLPLIKTIKEQVRSLLKGLKIHHITIETELESEECDLRECRA